MKISVGQFRPTGVMAENLSSMRRLAESAREDGAELVLFPEESMFTIRHVAGTLSEVVAQQWDGFVEGLQQIAEDLQLAVVAGGYEPSGTELPYNTLVAVDESGQVWPAPTGSCTSTTPSSTRSPTASSPATLAC